MYFGILIFNRIVLKTTFISDTHGQHKRLTKHIPNETELLIHAGDLSKLGTLPEIASFMDWFENLPIKHKVFIAGNHDFLMENEPTILQSLLDNYSNFHYLENSKIEIEGIRIWGSPISPFFFNWAFNVHRGAPIRAYWDRIPDNLDILITHGPPFGFGDMTARNEKVGCVDLLEKVETTKPKFHVFGHIHESYGISKNKATTFVNASVLNLKYELVNSPIMVEL
jgi:Icc-related predicted phosphoesterase